MEKKILAYEKLISGELKRTLKPDDRKSLLLFHYKMLENFQHERLIHLIITLFFSFMSIEFIIISIWTLIYYGFLLVLVPLYLITLILVVLTFSYVKHYYFLENHIQGLYKYAEKLKLK